VTKTNDLSLKIGRIYFETTRGLDLRYLFKELPSGATVIEHR